MCVIAFIGADAFSKANQLLLFVQVVPIYVIIIALFCVKNDMPVCGNSSDKSPFCNETMKSGPLYSRFKENMEFHGTFTFSNFLKQFVIIFSCVTGITTGSN